MIHSLFSDLPTFKNLEFGAGLNILLSEKSEGATEKQTRNRAGKSSFTEILHFLLGGNCDKDHLMRVKELQAHNFGMVVDVEQMIQVARSGGSREDIRISPPSKQFTSNVETLSNPEWIRRLGRTWFNLNFDDAEGRTPTTRSLLSYFIRRQSAGGFVTPEKQSGMQQASDQQIALMYLLGLDWNVAADWQKVRDQEKTIAELKKAMGDDNILGRVIGGKAADLRTQVAIESQRLEAMEKQLKTFKVLERYRELEQEASELTAKLNKLVNENTIDTSAIRDLTQALKAEVPPTLDDLETVYREAGVVFPDGLIKQKYEDVRRFHESVLRNRSSYLNSELIAAKARIEERSAQLKQFDTRRAEIMTTLKSHGALEQFNQLQLDVGRQQATVKTLQNRFDAATKLESTKTQLDVDRSQLALRLNRDFGEQEDKLTEAIRAFEFTSKQLYTSAGSMQIAVSDNGPTFKFIMQGDRSKGIKNMQIFCFDMMLMQLCHKRGIGPGFLVHDSHLFDGVDGRQVVRALRVGSEMAKHFGFQYIVTMNEDDAFKETEADFDLNDYVLPVRLTDATEDGGLFGIRF